MARSRRASGRRRDGRGLWQDVRGIWHASFSVQGRRVEKSLGTADEQAACEWHDAARARAWREMKMGAAPNHTWGEAIDAALARRASQKSVVTTIERLAWLSAPAGGGIARPTPLAEIGLARIDDALMAKQADGASNATINRYWAAISMVLRDAAAKGWITSVPRWAPLPERRVEPRWLLPDEAERLLAELPDHLRRMARFSLATGLRMSNVTGLTWDRVSLERRTAWVPIAAFKSGRTFVCPLNGHAIDALLEVRGESGEHCFTWMGRPLAYPNNNAFYAAVERAGINLPGKPRFSWHGFRHTWASWHIMAGTPRKVLQELGGWEDPEMVDTYAHLAQPYVAAYAANSMLGLAKQDA